MKEEDFDFIQKYNFSNSFWENIDVLYHHSKQRFDEYLNLNNLFKKISSLLNTLSDSLLDFTIPIQDSEIDYDSTRGNGILKVINFINRISQNMKKLSKSISDISNQMNNKVEVYQSRRQFETKCKENYNKYKDNIEKLNLRKDIYKDSVEAVIESFLNNKYKELKTPIDLKPKLEFLNKKKQEYKNEVKNCEEIRTEFIQVQRNLLENEEAFEKECTEEIKSYFTKAIDYYNQFLENNKIDKDTLLSIEKIDASKDVQIFSEKNRDIMSSPPRISFQEYNQDMDKYINFEVIKNKLKTANNEEGNLKKEISMEVNKFLEQTVFTMDENNEIRTKYIQIADDILNKKLKREDYNFIINEFQNKYSDFMEWKRTTIKDQDFMKVGSGWDNRFDSMHAFLNIFNKLRMYNKKLEKDNFNYFVSINKKILELNDGDEVDYNLCNLVIILASTFYTSEEKEGKEEKKYVAEEIKKCKLFQRFDFWVGLVKYQLNEEIIKERAKESQINRRGSFFNSVNKNLTSWNINFNFSFRFSSFSKKKEENKIDTVDRYNKVIMAKLMSVSYNLVQFVSSSDILNKALYNIFRFYKLSPKNRKNVVEMLQFQIASDGYDNLKIDEDLLFNNKIDEHYKNESKEEKEEDNGYNDIIIATEESGDKKDIMEELYNNEIKDDDEDKDDNNKNDKNPNDNEIKEEIKNEIKENEENDVKENINTENEIKEINKNETEIKESENNLKIDEIKEEIKDKIEEGENKDNDLKENEIKEDSKKEP